MIKENINIIPSSEKLINIFVPILFSFYFLKYDRFLSYSSLLFILSSVIFNSFIIIKICRIENNSITFINFLKFKFRRIFYQNISKVFIRETKYSCFMEILLLSNRMIKINIGFMNYEDRKIFIDRLRQKSISVEFINSSEIIKIYYFSHIILFFSFCLLFFTNYLIINYFKTINLIKDYEIMYLSFFIIGILTSIRFIKIYRNNITIFDIRKLFKMKRIFKFEEIESFWHYTAGSRFFLVVRLKSGKEYKYKCQSLWVGKSEEIVEKLKSKGISSGITSKIEQLSNIKRYSQK